MEKLSKEIQEQIEKAIYQLANAKRLKNESEELKAEADETLKPLMIAYGMKKYPIDGIGTAYSKVSRGKSFVEKKLRAKLLLVGLTPKVIDEVITETSTSWEKPYIEFRVEK